MDEEQNYQEELQETENGERDNQQSQSASNTRQTANSSKSTFDNARRTVRTARSVAKNAKRLRKAVQAARATAQTVQTGISFLIALFGSGVGEVLLVILLVIIGGFLLVIMVSVIFGATSTNATQIACSDVQGTCLPAGSSCNAPNVINVDATCATTTTNSSTSANSSEICCAPPEPTPTPGVPPPTGLHFYCQYDKKYTNCHSYCTNGVCYIGTCTNPATTCDIAVGGCSPSSVAMAITSFGASGYNPKTTAATAISTGITKWKVGCTYAGSNIYDFKKTIAGAGFTLNTSSTANIISNGVFNVTKARKAFAAGCYLVAAADMWYSEGGPRNDKGNGNGGHATFIVGIDSNNILSVYDPTWCWSDTNYKVRNFAANGSNVIISWWFVLPVCR